MYHNWTGELGDLYKHVEDMRLSYPLIDIDIDVQTIAFHNDGGISEYHWTGFTRDNVGFIVADHQWLGSEQVDEALFIDESMSIWVTQPVSPDGSSAIYVCKRITETERMAVSY